MNNQFHVLIGSSFKVPVARSISAGPISPVAKDQSMDMNGPVVPEKVLKSIQV